MGLYRSSRIYKLTYVLDGQFSIPVLFLKKIASVHMLMNGIKICFYCIFVYKGVNSPLNRNILINLLE